MSKMEMHERCINISGQSNSFSLEASSHLQVEEFGVYRSICVMIRRSCPYLSVGAPDCADGMSVDVMSSHGSQAAKKNKVA